MIRDEETRQRIIERDVLTYVLERPAAKDTAEGVRHWWLREAGEVTARDVRAVLASLEAKGWMAARGMQGEAGEDATVYELNTERTAEIRSYLVASRPADSPSSSAPLGMPGETPRG